jgi:hypothetical protein
MTEEDFGDYTSQRFEPGDAKAAAIEQERQRLEATFARHVKRKADQNGQAGPTPTSSQTSEPARKPEPELKHVNGPQLEPPAEHDIPLPGGPEDYGTERKAHDDTYQRGGQAGGKDGQKTEQTYRGFSLTYFGDLSGKPTPKSWVIKNVIARGETSSWIAPPGKGKSALWTDIAVHAAADLNWRGYMTKGSTGVVYFALERADLVRRRLIAHKLRDGLTRLPIAVVSEVIDLLNKSCVEAILQTVRRAEQRFECEAGLLIFDTFSKGIAAGGGDEDKAKDQNAVNANLRRLFDRGLNAHIAGVGHTGKDESKGERGSNARKADVDVQAQLTGEAIKTVTIKKANDQPEGFLTAFKLERFSFGRDEDGDTFDTFILAPEVHQSTAADSKQKMGRLSAKQSLALRALTEATLSQGREPPPEYGLPKGIKVASDEVWREELFRQNVIDRDGTNPRARYAELHQGLKFAGRIGSRDQWVWAAQLTPQTQED